MSTMEGVFQASSSKVAIWLFIVSDALTFTALLLGYGFMRMLSPTWPIRTEIFDMRLITFMTFVLISSSALMAMAVSAAQSRQQSHAVRFLIGTIGGGVVFLGCQAYEWSHFIREGALPFTNPWGVPQFGASFFVVTGFHGLHVGSRCAYGDRRSGAPRQILGLRNRSSRPLLALHRCGVGIRICVFLSALDCQTACGAGRRGMGWLRDGSIPLRFQGGVAAPQ